MNTPMRTVLASSIAAVAGWAMTMPASGQESTTPSQPAATQGQAQESSALAMPGCGPGMGMKGGMGPGYGKGMRGDCPGAMMGGGMGPGMGMMGGMGPGMMGGGMGPGMMGGMGPGMMGGGMGPGMMMGGGMSGFGPGAGMGPGMMGPGMMGPGMMGPGMMGSGMAHLGMLNLSDAQTTQIENIKTEWKKQQRPLMRQIWEEQDKLNDLTTAEKRDPRAIGKAYSRLSELHRQALEAHIEMENKVMGVLTPEQRTQMRRSSGPGMMGY